MKKHILSIGLPLLVGITLLNAQTVTSTHSDSYSAQNVAAANLPATITTLSTEKPSSGATLANLNVFRLPSGTYNINAIYR